MPAYDGTGPAGAGPFTGRGIGSCGFGWRNMFSQRCGIWRIYGLKRELSREEKEKYLQEYKLALTEEMENVEAMLKNPDK